MISNYQKEQQAKKQVGNKDFAAGVLAPIKDEHRIEDIRIIPLKYVNPMDSNQTSRAEDSDPGTGRHLK